MHSRTKHIEINHRFLREHISNGTFEIKFTGTDLQLANLFIKPLAKDRFNFLLNELGIINVNAIKNKFVYYQLNMFVFLLLV